MARGQNASTGRTARSERVLQPTINAFTEVAKANGFDPKKMTLGDAEKVLIEGANRGYPASASDLKDIYGEQSYEMRANDMRPPPYSTWVKERAATTLFQRKRDAEQQVAVSTPQGAKLDEAYKSSVETARQASDEESKARNSFEAAVKDATGESLRDFRFTLPNKTLNSDGKRVGTDKERQEQYFKGRFPTDYKKLEEAIAKRNKADEARRDAGEARRNFINGREA
jgi:hypothetical protein